MAADIKVVGCFEKDASTAASAMTFVKKDKQQGYEPMDYLSHREYAFERAKFYLPRVAVLGLLAWLCPHSPKTPIQH